MCTKNLCRETTWKRQSKVKSPAGSSVPCVANEAANDSATEDSQPLIESDGDVADQSVATKENQTIRHDHDYSKNLSGEEEKNERLMVNSNDNPPPNVMSANSIDD